MALRKPLVLGADGLWQQLQAGDTLNAVVSGGEQIMQTNDEVGSIVIGAPVYNDASDGVKKAKADAAGTSNLIGLVAQTSVSTGTSGAVQVGGVVTATTAQWDAVAGTTGGLTFGTWYFLSDATAGLLTATPPTTGGHYLCTVGIALSATELLLKILPRLLL